MQSTPFARSHYFWLCGGAFTVSVWAILTGTMAATASRRCVSTSLRIVHSDSTKNGREHPLPAALLQLHWLDF